MNQHKTVARFEQAGYNCRALVNFVCTADIKHTLTLFKYSKVIDNNNKVNCSFSYITVLLPVPTAQQSIRTPTNNDFIMM